MRSRPAHLKGDRTTYATTTSPVLAGDEAGCEWLELAERASGHREQRFAPQRVLREPELSAGASVERCVVRACYGLLVCDAQQTPPEGPEGAWWSVPVGGGICIILFLWLLFVLLADPGHAMVISEASTTVGLVGTIGTFGALVVLIRQLEEQSKQLALQRAGLEDQRERTEREHAAQQEELKLHRQALDDQRKALNEQRRASHRARFNSLRDSYADYLGATTELLAIFTTFADLAPSPDSWARHVQTHKGTVDQKRVDVFKFVARIALHDRDNERARIRVLLGKALGPTRTIQQAFHDARSAALELRNIANTRDPQHPVAAVDNWTEKLLGYLTAEQHEAIDGDGLKRMQTAALVFGQGALLASLTVEEQETFSEAA